MIVKHTGHMGHMYVRNWIGSRCTLPSTREEKRGAIVDPGRGGGEGGEKRKERRREGDRGGVGYRILVSHTGSSGWVSGAFSLVFSANLSRWHRFTVDHDPLLAFCLDRADAVLSSLVFQKATHARRGVDVADPRQNRYPIKTSAPLRNLLRLLQIDFSLPFQPSWMEPRVCVEYTSKNVQGIFIEGLSLSFFFEQISCCKRCKSWDDYT